MSKSIYFNGQPIFSHLLSLLSRDKIEQIAAEGDYDRYTNKFDTSSYPTFRCPKRSRFTA